MSPGIGYCDLPGIDREIAVRSGRLSCDGKVTAKRYMPVNAGPRLGPTGNLGLLAKICLAVPEFLAGLESLYDSRVL